MRERTAAAGKGMVANSDSRPARPGPFSARYQYPDHKIYRKFNVLELFGMTKIGAGVGEQSEGRESDLSIDAS